MSRQIPMDQPLSDEDRQYLLDRDRRDLIAHIDEMNSPAEADESGDGDGDDYDTWKKDDLVEEATKRELDASGTKAEIIARLREDDAEDEGGSE